MVILGKVFIKMGHMIETNGIKAVPRKDTDDYELLFLDREPGLKPVSIHIALR
jgi:hypothetical protein